MSISEILYYSIFLVRQSIIFICHKIQELKHKTFNELSSEDIYEYESLIKQFVEYLKENLTTDKIATYILKTTNNVNVTNILYISEEQDVDYLRNMTLHGFKKLFGSKCHDYFKVNNIYKNHSQNPKDLYGLGFTCSGLLDNSLHVDMSENEIKIVEIQFNTKNEH
mgnify:CR=1 FL=1